MKYVLHTSITSALNQKGWKGLGHSKSVTVKICVTDVTVHYLNHTQVLDLNWSGYLLFPKSTYSQGREIPGQLTLAMKAGAVLFEPKEFKVKCVFSMKLFYDFSVSQSSLICVLKKKACWRFVHSSDINVESSCQRP